jgi:hypothetical protein
MSAGENTDFVRARFHKAFERSIVIFVLAIGVMAVVYSLALLVIAFESSEYNKTPQRRWNDFSDSIPVWITLLSLTAGSWALAKYRRFMFAGAVSMVSGLAIWLLLTGKVTPALWVNSALWRLFY